MREVEPAEIVRVRYRPPGGDALDIEVMSIAELRRRAPITHFARLQRADFFQLIGVTAGHARMMVDFGHHPLRARHWLLIRPGQVMRYDFVQPWNGWLTVFRPEAIFSDLRAGAPGAFAARVEALEGHWQLQAGEHRALVQAARQMLTDSRAPAGIVLRNEMLHHQLSAALLRLASWQDARRSERFPPGAAALQFRRFRRLLEREFAAIHEVRHYAQLLHLSARTLNRACQAASGSSAKDLVSERVALEARRLLAHTRRPVRQISDELGFAEPTHFVKFFRRLAGCTPGAFRQRHAGAA